MSYHEAQYKPLVKSCSAKRLGRSASRTRNSMSYGAVHKQLPQVLIEKEQLYVETLALKGQLNSAGEEIARLKDKVARLRQELDKTRGVISELSVKDQANAAVQMISKLKRTVRILKSKNCAQEEELQDVKKKLRVTQFVELEAEKQVLMFECTRLRRQLEQTLHASEANENYISDDALKTENELLKMEIAGLKATQPRKPRQRQSFGEIPKRRGIATDSRQLSSMQDQLALTLSQLQETKESLELERRSRQDITSRSRDRSSVTERPSQSMTPDTVANSFIDRLHKELKGLKKDLDTVMAACSSHGFLTPSDFYDQLHFSGLSFSEAEVKEMWRGLFKGSQVSLHLLLTALKAPSAFELLDSYSISRDKDYSDRSLVSQAAETTDGGRHYDIIDHVVMRMQLHRVTNQEAVQLLSELKKGSPMTQQSVLTAEPFELKSQDHCSKLLGVLKGLTSLDSLAKLLGTWRVMEDSEEAQFDAELAKKIPPVKARLTSTCQLYDRTQSGSIGLTELFTAMKSCGIDLQPRLKMYIRLLSYSFDYQLDVAPYINLINAFTKQEDSVVLADISEEEQEQIVRRVLCDAVNAINRLGVTLTSVFETTKGLITPKELLEGFNALLTENLKQKEFLVLLAVLQSDNYEDTVVEFCDLEALVKELMLSMDDEHPNQPTSMQDSPGQSRSVVLLTEYDPVKRSSRGTREA
jgi:Ca2+-binding EF-hand superfamily protein